MSFSPGCGTNVPDALAPDTVLLNGKILTVDLSDRIAEAVAIKDGKILAVGTTEEIRALGAAETRVVDLTYPQRDEYRGHRGNDG